MHHTHTRFNLIAVLSARPTGDEELNIAITFERFTVGWIEWCQENDLPFILAVALQAVQSLKRQVLVLLRIFHDRLKNLLCLLNGLSGAKFNIQAT